MGASPDEPDLLRDVDVAALARRYEPVLRYTQGEMFFPMSVGAYVGQAALWSADRAGAGQSRLIVDHGKLDLDTLDAESRVRPDERLYLRYAPKPLDRRQLRQGRRDAMHPRFTGVSRLAAVGLLGRIIDSLMRLSLTLRGRVPGGLTAAVWQRYQASPASSEFVYYAHVTTDAGYVAIQYWFLYAMNDWRTTFGGVNDHESDWEQVTIYLAAHEDAPDAPDAPADPDGLHLAWLAFSSHDTIGDELRRRVDDPDITWIDGTHPVVFCGAGSHSGAYLPGDYLVRAEPPALRRVFTFVGAVRSTLFPWTRHRSRPGVGIPYVDYKRGDGVHIGPGTDRPWIGCLIASTTPWIRDYPGLWGLDTFDPFGGERAPAGPRYERSGAIRTSWADPAGWAGLDKVAPTRSQRIAAEIARVGELRLMKAELDKQIYRQQRYARRSAAGAGALPATMTATRDGDDDAVETLESRASTLVALRRRRRAVVTECEYLRRSLDDGSPLPAPHAHLRHRAVPDSDLQLGAGTLLRLWSGASLSVLLAMLGLAFFFDLAPARWAFAAAVVVVMGVEALLRRRFLLFLLGLVITTAIAVVAWLLVAHTWQACGVLALGASVAIGIANLRVLAAPGR